jgi:type I restriction enzyme S subunit
LDEKKTVLEILNELKKTISTQELWTNSIHEGDIESFYSEIKEIFDQLDEIKESTESLLS